MLFSSMIDRFVEASPFCVMARGLMERALSPAGLDAVFEKSAEQQYTKALLFSTTVDLMSTVVCRIRPSVHAAYQAKKADVGVSVRALYDKLASVELKTSAAVVEHTAERLEPIIRQMGGTSPPLLEGYKAKILDGNHLAHSERRMGILRDVAAGPLPGQTLVVYEPETDLVTGVIGCEDGHTQERKLLDQIWPLVHKRDLWIADRNFCTTKFLSGVAARCGFFAVRQHASTLRWEREGRRRKVGKTDSGVLYERRLWLLDEDGKEFSVRQITLELTTPTRDGETVIRVLSNLPSKIPAAKIAALYRERWKIEHLFQKMTQLLRCEIDTLAYPKAAVFGFCVALAASNVLAATKAALRATHKDASLDDDLSDFMVAEELSGTYRGMMIALPGEEWTKLAALSDSEFMEWLLAIAKRVRLDRYQKSKRGPKKPPPTMDQYRNGGHVSTYKLLRDKKH